MRDPRTDTVIAAADLSDFEGNWGKAAAEAIEEAQAATIRLLRAELLDLADTWTQFRGYFTAWKHGGLAANREDFALSHDGEVVRDPAVAVWARRRREPFEYLQVASKVSPAFLAREVHIAGLNALEVAQFLVGRRLAFAELAIDNYPKPDRAPAEKLDIPYPLKFWYEEGDVSPRAEEVLRSELKISLAPLKVPARAARETRS